MLWRNFLLTGATPPFAGVSTSVQAAGACTVPVMDTAGAGFVAARRPA